MQLKAPGSLKHRRVDCFHCPHRAREWSSLNGDLSLLNEIKSVNVYMPGQVIFYQGNPCLGLYCVEEGTVALRKCDAQGNEVIVRLVHAGETLGTRTFFAGGEYTASAVALTPCRICFIEKDTLQRLLDRNPGTTKIFLENISKALQRAEEDKLRFVTLPVRARLAYLLLELKDRYGEMDENYNINIYLPISRQDMALMIATRPETLSRTIRALEKDGVVKFDKRRVQIPDLDALLDEVENFQ